MKILLFSQIASQRSFSSRSPRVGSTFPSTSTLRTSPPSSSYFWPSRPNSSSPSPPPAKPSPSLPTTPSLRSSLSPSSSSAHPSPPTPSPSSPPLPPPEESSLSIVTPHEPLTDWAIIKKLARNIWPKSDNKVKVRVVLALSLLVGGKILNVQVPFFFKDIVDSLNLPVTDASTVWLVVGWSILGCEWISPFAFL